MNNQTIFRGETYFLTELYYPIDKENRLFYLMFDANDRVQWVSFTQSQLKSASPIVKLVYPGTNPNELFRKLHSSFFLFLSISVYRTMYYLEFQDDFNQFMLRTSGAAAKLQSYPYETQYEFMQKPKYDSVILNYFVYILGGILSAFVSPKATQPAIYLISSKY